MFKLPLLHLDLESAVSHLLDGFIVAKVGEVQRAREHYLQLANFTQTPHHQNMDRIALLAQVLEQNPADAFARYGLAMAYAAENDTDKALDEFNVLIQHNPDYVPAYQMSAQTLAKLSRTEEAIIRLKEGLAAAQRTGNDHAASEMQAHLDDLAT